MSEQPPSNPISTTDNDPYTANNGGGGFAEMKSKRPSRSGARPVRLPPTPYPSLSPPSSPRQPQHDIVTPLVAPPLPFQVPRWRLRSMWQFASVLNFLNVFRQLLNVNVEFSAEELETALMTPNNTLGNIHIPLLKAIPPIPRIAPGCNTWITVLCRKLKDWWYWVAEGELPIVASHGTEVEAYNALDPGVRVLILKALCDIRVEQEDIRKFIDDSIQFGLEVSAFCKERVGGDSYGISYWYEDDPIIGHRLYRETRRMEIKQVKGKDVPPASGSSYQWEAVATNFDEFHDVAEKLLSSKNRIEVSLGKKLKIDMLPEIEKVHKKKERLLKKQHRQTLLLDSRFNLDGLGPGRSRRDRKRISYTFDDYDRSINEAIKKTKRKQLSLEATDRRETAITSATTNDRWTRSLRSPQQAFLDMSSPKSSGYDVNADCKHDVLDHSNLRRQRPELYSVENLLEAVSNHEAEVDADDDVVGEVVYDEEYLMRKKQERKLMSLKGDQFNHSDEYHQYAYQDDSSSVIARDGNRGGLIIRFKLSRHP